MPPAATPGPFPPSFPPVGPYNFGDWWWSLGANVWSFITVQAGPLAAFAAILTAVVAIVALGSTARDSRERSRPVVLALFRIAEHNDTAFDFVVRNYGQSAARNVKVTFDPPFGPDERQHRLTEILAQRYDDVIPLLPPSVEVPNLWWSGPPMTNTLKTPNKVRVTITYKGNRLRSYKEIIPLDAEWMKRGTYSVSSTSTPGRMKTISEALGTIAKEASGARRELRDIGEALGTGELGDEPPPPGTTNILRVLGGGFVQTEGERAPDSGEPEQGDGSPTDQG